MYGIYRIWYIFKRTDRIAVATARIAMTTDHFMVCTCRTVCNRRHFAIVCRLHLSTRPINWMIVTLKRNTMLFFSKRHHMAVLFPIKCAALMTCHTNTIAGTITAKIKLPFGTLTHRISFQTATALHVFFELSPYFTAKWSFLIARQTVVLSYIT